MKLRLIQHPVTPSRKIRLNTLALYDQYLQDNAVNDNVLRNDKEHKDILNNLDFAVTAGSDVFAIKKLIELGAIGRKDMLAFAIANHVSADVFMLLFTHYGKFVVEEPIVVNGRDISQGIIIPVLVRTMLFWGTEEIFDAFLENNLHKQLFCKQLNNDYSSYIHAAAKGGNSSLMSKLILLQKDKRMTQKQLYDQFHVALGTPKTDFIFSAIDGGSPTCLGLILDELKQVDYRLTSSQHLTYLMKAIKSNHPSIVKKMLDIMPKEQVKSIHISLSLLQQTNLPVLRLLKQSGIPFSNNALAIITQKEHQWVNMIRWILTVVEKMRDYFQDNPPMYYKPGLFEKNAEKAEDYSLKKEMNGFSPETLGVRARKKN